MPMGRQDAPPLTHTHMHKQEIGWPSLPKGRQLRAATSQHQPSTSRVPGPGKQGRGISCQLLYRPGYPSKSVCQALSQSCNEVKPHRELGSAIRPFYI